MGGTKWEVSVLPTGAAVTKREENPPDRNLKSGEGHCETRGTTASECQMAKKGTRSGVRTRGGKMQMGKENWGRASDRGNPS